VTSRGQIVVRRTAVTPADGQWTLTPGKFWFMNDDAVDTSKVFTAVEFQSHQAELANIIELAEKLGDQESSVPAMAQGERGTAPDTVGGMQLLMNSANVVLRRLVKQYDDYVTKKHIRRYYEYNMSYGEDDDIKGDFAIDARGSAALLVRDIQNQAYTNLLQAAANPVLAPLINHKALFEKALKGQHIDPAGIMKSDEEIEALEKQPPPVDPRVQAAQASAQGRVQEAQAISQGRAQEVQARIEQEVQDRALRMEELRLNHDLQVMKIAAQQQMSIDAVKAQLAQVTINDRTKKELAASEMLFKQNGSPDHKGI
jgi:hypothetical protein